MDDADFGHQLKIHPLKDLIVPESSKIRVSSQNRIKISLRKNRDAQWNSLKVGAVSLDCQPHPGLVLRAASESQDAPVGPKGGPRCFYYEFDEANVRYGRW